jgi:hypothetical protein
MRKLKTYMLIKSECPTTNDRRYNLRMGGTTKKGHSMKCGHPLSVTRTEKLKRTRVYNQFAISSEVVLHALKSSESSHGTASSNAIIDRCPNIDFFPQGCKAESR